MASASDRGELVLEGTWLYAGEVRSRIAIVRRNEWYGSGDDEDPPEVADDREVETFEILYADPQAPTRFIAGGGRYSTLEEARAAAEAACGATVRWQEAHHGP